MEFAFFDNPDQWELFMRERPETAVDEIAKGFIHGVKDLPVCYH
ncbi:MAG: hypothetical protein U0Q47_10675 [Mycobacterium sp.]